MFNFRIITCADGTDIIDTTLKTPYNALTGVEMVEYTEMEKHLACMERIKRQEQRKKDRQRRMMRNPLYRLACVFGLS